jgi:hypothetical protein
VVEKKEVGDEWNALECVKVDKEKRVRVLRCKNLEA